MFCRMCGQKEVSADRQKEFPLMCPDCIAEATADAEKIGRLISEGHSRHCACRQAWGDGECECKKSGPMTEAKLDSLIEAVKKEIRP